MEQVTTNSIWKTDLNQICFEIRFSLGNTGSDITWLKKSFFFYKNWCLFVGFVFVLFFDSEFQKGTLRMTFWFDINRFLTVEGPGLDQHPRLVHPISLS